LVVVRLDRLARSVSHLLLVIEQLAAKGAHFRSLRDPIDTTTPQGMFSLQVLGAVAQLERALIAERTKAGLLVARKHGRIGGNPGLRASAWRTGRRSCIDDMTELRTDLSFGFDTVRPVHDRAVARGAPMRCDLFGPLVGRVHRVCPTDRVMV
jgi:DNA invertase Pin-like site-specific DNA recombinase